MTRSDRSPAGRTTTSAGTKHDLKLMANYIHTRSDYRESNAQYGRAEFDEVILRLQVMF